MKFQLLIAIASTVAASESIASELDQILEKELPEVRHLPTIFAGRGAKISCAENGVIQSWCPDDCGILMDHNEYACACKEASACPDECIDGVQPMAKTGHSIRCHGIPEDEPNYVLKEPVHSKESHCENNAIVAGWCDDYVNRHLTCTISEKEDTYECYCGGKHAACPDECVGGATPLSKTGNKILCKGIPLDQPNYILKSS